MSERRDAAPNASADATEVISANEYERKVGQLRAETDIMSDLGDAATDIHDGISMISEARDQIDEGRDDAAADTADQAYELLTDVEDRLDEWLSDLDADADAFEDVGDDFLDLASSRAAIAENIYDRYS